MAASVALARKASEEATSSLTTAAAAEKADIVLPVGSVRYTIIEKIGEGSFSEVLKARNSSTGAVVAIKCLKSDKGLSGHWPRGSRLCGVPVALGAKSLECKEVFALRLIKPHINVIKILQVFKDVRTRRLCLVTELLDMNLYEFLQRRQGRALSETEVKHLMYQALHALAHVHKCGFFHRDVKPENMLVNRTGTLLKVADFGSCREIVASLRANSAAAATSAGLFGAGGGGGYHHHLGGAQLTEYIATRWYRAPECLLTNGRYGVEMDVWSLGCVMAEMLLAAPLFPGKDEVHQLLKIQEVLGPIPTGLVAAATSSAATSSAATGRHHQNHHLANRQSRLLVDAAAAISAGQQPNAAAAPKRPLRSLLRHVSPECLDLLRKVLSYAPGNRISAAAALQHRFFDSLHALPPPLFHPREESGEGDELLPAELAKRRVPAFPPLHPPFQAPKMQQLKAAGEAGRLLLHHPSAASPSASTEISSCGGGAGGGDGGASSNSSFLSSTATSPHNKSDQAAAAQVAGDSMKPTGAADAKRVAHAISAFRHWLAGGGKEAAASNENCLTN